MGCGICCLKCLLILFNTLFGLIGLVLLAAGAVILAAANKYIGPYLDNALKSLPGLTSSFSLDDSSTINVGDLKLNIVQILSPVAIFLVVFGSILVVCAIFGSCGSCCSNRIMLIVYAAIVLLLLLIQVIMVSLFFSGSLDGQIKSKMKSTITNDFVALDDMGLWSMAWNAFMIEYKCCGVDGYGDFADAKKWKKERTVTVLGFAVPIVLTTPFTCCKFSGTFPNVSPMTDTCAVLPNELDSNWKQGCYAPLKDELKGTYTILIGAISGMLIFQLLCAIAAIVIAMYIQKEKNEMV